MRLAVTITVGALWFVPLAAARGGHYAFDGGTDYEQAQVAAALDASTFNLVPQTITVHIGPTYDDQALPGEVWLNSFRLDVGEGNWGTVQHEFAHQVDFYVLTDAQRETLRQFFGVAKWYPATVDEEHADHADLGAERFATMVSWAYWQAQANNESPIWAPGEASADPAAFRALMTSLGFPQVLTCRRYLFTRGRWVTVRHHRRWKPPVYRKVCS
jgi:hypothetical protein